MHWQLFRNFKDQLDCGDCELTLAIVGVNDEDETNVVLTKIVYI